MKNDKEYKKHRRGNKYHHNGYVEVYCPDHPNAKKGVVLEHRLIAEEKLKRYLEEYEVIHHINGIRDDNRISNLQLFTSKGKHRHHHAILNGQKNIRPNNYKYSEDHKRKIAEANLGRPRPIAEVRYKYYQEGKSKSRIARELKISRDTVYNYLGVSKRAKK